MQLPYEHSGFGRNYAKSWIATEKSGKTHPASWWFALWSSNPPWGSCDLKSPVVWRSHTPCSTESNPSIGGSNDSDPSYLFTKRLKKTTTRRIQAKNSPIHPRNSWFSSGFWFFQSRIKELHRGFAPKHSPPWLAETHWWWFGAGQFQKACPFEPRKKTRPYFPWNPGWFMTGSF